MAYTVVTQGAEDMFLVNQHPAVFYLRQQSQHVWKLGQGHEIDARSQSQTPPHQGFVHGASHSNHKQYNEEKLAMMEKSEY